MSNVSISVVLPVKNGQRYLDSVLKAVLSQEINAEFEVIIIDSGSRDKTRDILRQYPIKLYQIEEKEFNHGLTRNTGISKAQGKYIVLMTQDAVPSSKHWMSTLIKDIEKDSRIAGVYCRQISRADADILTKRDLNNHLTARKEKVINFIQDSKEYESLTPMERYIFCYFDNVCSCIRRSVWEKIPFAETDFAEDIDWSKKALEAGYKIVYEPASAVTHSHNGSLLYQYRRSYIHHKRLYELFRLQPVLTRNKVILFSLCNIIRDAYYVIKNEKLSTNMLQTLLTLPASSFLKILGQYRGAKEANENITSNS